MSSRRRERSGDTELRQLVTDLDNNVKPLFDEYGPEGVPMGELRGRMEEEGITDTMSEERLKLLLDLADQDDNKMITYGEFVDVIVGKDGVKTSERSGFRRSFSAAMRNLLHLRRDYLANCTCCPPPWFILTISTVEIIIFGVYASELAQTSTPVTATSGYPSYSPLVYKPTRRYEAWRFLTYMFIHMGWVHILLNMIFQLVFGVALELIHSWRVIILYLLGVTAGSLAHSITDHLTSLVGASGGVYALYGAHLAALITNWKEMNYKWRDGVDCHGYTCSEKCKSATRLLLSAPAMLIYVFGLVIPDTALAIYQRITAPEGQKVGIAAHIGGFLCGLLLGVPILKNINKKPWETTLGWITLAVYLACVVFAVLFNGLYKGYPETDWS